MYTDPIADYLTRIRNAQMAKHKVVTIPASKIKTGITEILFEHGYIHRYKIEGEGKDKAIMIALKYDRETKEPVIRKLERMSRPGLRKFSKAKDIPRIINGLGTCIVSTSHGLMTDKKARENNYGGELICLVY